MWQGLKDWFKDRDGKRADEMAGLAILGVLTFLGLEIYSVAWQGRAFDPAGFGQGLGLALAAAAIGMGLKAKWEAQGGQ